MEWGGNELDDMEYTPVTLLASTGEAAWKKSACVCLACSYPSCWCPL